MRQESAEKNTPLRSGFTTGSCATVTSLAAAHLLLLDQNLPQLSITLPKGQHVDFAIKESLLLDATTAYASTVKDAGDDPDVTHRATVFAKLSLTPQPGVFFKAGQGVGTVTRPGLALAVGEPAINPVPRQMMTSHLSQLAKQTGYRGGFLVCIGIENGESLALKTMNPRLGILGGLSILGTTGIVRPFSCSAYIASIYQGIDVARANGVKHIAACTGDTSDKFITQQYNLPEIARLEMGDFVGAVLKHIKRHPIDKLTLVGGFGKFSKLAYGAIDLHSRKSSIDFEFLSQQAKFLGAKLDLQEEVRQANTSLAALAKCQEIGLALGDRISDLALQQAKKIVPPHISVEVFTINKTGKMVGYANHNN